jgi:hypothetical protein
MQSEWEETRVTWYLGANSDMSGDLVVASVQKLTRPEGLAELDRQRFDYVVIDEVHHAQAPSYRRVMARLNATFTLGLTATPERTDGVDVASLFDDVLAWQATVGDGIAEGSLVPFHYLGLKDDVDFEQIPWRNGRFDPTALEEKLENSERMERLWTAWQADPEARTLVFCCSRRHALYTRDWLRRRQVRAAAVFSGSGGDPRSDSLNAFIDGKLQALCVVDLFNEGLDVPDVDRVVMLRPTESKVIFLQQLGRGLRAAENKLRLKVIDFVGNHRVFASRLTHLLSLGNQSATWAHLKKFLKGGTPDLPEGCLLDLEVEAKELMLRLLPNTGSAVVEAYRSMRDELGRRPSPSELFHHGYLPRTLAARFGSWFGFISEENDLTESERRSSPPSSPGSPCWRPPASTSPTRWSSCACCWIATRCGTAWKSKNSPPPAASSSFPTRRSATTCRRPSSFPIPPTHRSRHGPSGGSNGRCPAGWTSRPAVIGSSARATASSPPSRARKISGPTSNR